MKKEEYDFNFEKIVNDVAINLIDLMTEKFKEKKETHPNFSNYVAGVTTTFVLRICKNSTLCFAEDFPKENIQELFKEYLNYMLNLIEHNGKKVEVSRDELRVM